MWFQPMLLRLNTVPNGVVTSMENSSEPTTVFLLLLTAEALSVFVSYRLFKGAHTANSLGKKVEMASSPETMDRFAPCPCFQLLL